MVRAGTEHRPEPDFGFFLAQFRNMQPANALLWIPGIVALLRARSIRDGRWLGVTYLVFFVMMMALHAKDYYLAAIYPATFAAGGILKTPCSIPRRTAKPHCGVSGLRWHSCSSPTLFSYR